MEPIVALHVALYAVTGIVTFSLFFPMSVSMAMERRFLSLLPIAICVASAWCVYHAHAIYAFYS